MAVALRLAILRQYGRLSLVEQGRREQRAPPLTLLQPFDAASSHLNSPRVLRPFVSQASEEPGSEMDQLLPVVVNLCWFCFSSSGVVLVGAAAILVPPLQLRPSPARSAHCWVDHVSSWPAHPPSHLVMVGMILRFLLATVCKGPDSIQAALAEWRENLESGFQNQAAVACEGSLKEVYELVLLAENMDLEHVVGRTRFACLFRRKLTCWSLTTVLRSQSAIWGLERTV
jgi:hypothetical protein